MAVRQIEADEASILETLSDTDGPVRRVDLAANCDDEEFVDIEQSLLDDSLIEEVGKENVPGPDGTRVIHRRFMLTDDGDRALRRAAQADEPEDDPTTVEPETRTARSKQWDTGDWTTPSPTVETLLDATTSVELNDDANNETDTLVQVRFNAAGEPITVGFTNRDWYTSGKNTLFDRLYPVYDQTNQLTERDFGLLQARWIDMAHESEHPEQNDQEHETERTEQSDSSVSTDSDTDLDTESKSDRVKRYLREEWTDESVREIATELDVSTGTVQNAKREFTDSEG